MKTINRSRNRSRRVITTGMAAAAIGVVALAGCGTDSPSGSDAASGVTTTSAASGSPSASAHNAADVMFNQMMIPHHQQAIAMADLVPSRTDNAAVRELATQIRNAQQPEIDQMTQRLQAWGMPTMMSGSPSMQMGGHGDGHSMGSMQPSGMGMMSDAEMTALENARGAEFDRLWLQGMITHHQGAIDMANTELQQGVNPASRELAQQIKTSQQAEIDRMRQLLG
ncbi:DUF305 domain-containing protein [Gordonia sp. NPDC003425]